ncbi:MAG TPA: serine/threonine-protein kinase [Candidatus Polarisedimenticolia bacterium]|nr:serine/threonine-protein kinase [Candidatus Polarisedimenticolia bacterium]
MPKSIGRYEILEEIGRGSMGVVYKARDPRIGRIVALKTIAFSFPLGPGEEEEFLQRFYHEAQVAGRLNHPNIVTIYNVGERSAGGDAYIAMEFVNGTNLHELLAGGGRLPLAQVSDVIEKLAQALDYAHDNGVVHRDIKPANILLTESGQPKILDFGIARLSAGGLTRPGKFFGTPNYMSPEQVTGTEVDGRTDQFSLGVILYQLLTGEKPFVGDSVTAISYQVVNVDPPPPTKLNPALRPPFDRIVRKVLSKSASDRYTRCAEFAADLLSAVAEWRASADKATPPTLVSREDAKAAESRPAEGGRRGVTFLAPRFAQLLAGRGSTLGIGWIAFLVCLVLLASAPFLLYRSPDGRPAGPQPLGLLSGPSFPGSGAGKSLSGIGISPGAAPTDPAQAARLRVTMSHRFTSGRIEVRLDGATLLEEKLKGPGTKTRFTRTLPVGPGSHRVEVRVVSSDFDQIEGIQGDFRPKEQRVLAISLSPISRRLKMRFDEPATAGAHR